MGEEKIKEEILWRIFQKLQKKLKMKSQERKNILIEVWATNFFIKDKMTWRVNILWRIVEIISQKVKM